MTLWRLNNFERRLKTLSDLKPYENVCKIWTSEAEKFIINPALRETATRLARSIIKDGDTTAFH